MCPDIETYAPLISAGFGLADVAGEGAATPATSCGCGWPTGRWRPTNPLLARRRAAGRARRRPADGERRCSTSPAPSRCARRFGFGDDDLERMTDWVDDAGIRWGIDAEHRGSYGLGGSSNNTWALGLDRVLLGVAMSGRRPPPGVGAVLPVDDVGRGDVDLVGRFAELVDRLHAFVAAAEAAARSPTGRPPWRDGVAALTATRPDEAWQVAQFERELARIAAGPATSDDVLRLADVRALLRQRLGGRPTRANFRTGTLTVCTMVPMRSVPHRVVCLVGLDDGVFPRVARRRRRRRAGPPPADRRARHPQPRTASCCSTRSSRPPRRWWSPTPAPASTPAPRDRPPCRWASCSTPLDRTAADAGARPRR